ALGVSLLADAAPLQEVHGAMLKSVVTAKSALRGAARILLAGEVKPRQGDEGKIAAPVEVLEERVDAVYVDHLFDAVERFMAGDDDWFQPWLHWLTNQAKVAFQETKDRVPSSSGR